MPSYTGVKTKEIAFPLGGIGSGSVCLAGNGRFMDWEIFNRPAKGSLNGPTHFAVKAERDGRLLDARVLQGDTVNNFMGPYTKTEFGGYGYGPNGATMGGYPHFKGLTFVGEYPVANLKFYDARFPAEVTLTAFNPLIPLNDKDSSIPGAFFEIEFYNTDIETNYYTVGFTVKNPFSGKTINKSVKVDGINAVHMVQEEPTPTDAGDLCFATDCDDTATQLYWFRGSWHDAPETYWRDFIAPGHIRERNYEEAGGGDVATITARCSVKPGERKKIRFILTWNVPVCRNYWNPAPEGENNEWKNYYAVLFKDSLDSALYSVKNWSRLYEETDKFRRAMFSSTLPSEVIDAASANLSTLKSPTVLRLEDGSFYGWEGVHELAGSCEGTCTHVWNYAYALPFLFPNLERSIRDLDFKYNQSPDGRMTFRMNLPLGRERYGFRACVDGQMGGIIKSYREWKISGDDEWLKQHWASIKNTLSYAWSDSNPDRWDHNKDGVLEGRQHHTLDIEMFGPSPWLQGYYFAALKAAAIMADYLGEPETAAEYRALVERGSKWMEENLFNGKYYQQKIDINDRSILAEYEGADEFYWNEEAGEIKYQMGEGSDINQVIAQWHANICGLGDIYDKDHLHTALLSLFQNNFKLSMHENFNPWRLYCLDDESGVINCAFPEGVKKVAIPVPYCQETFHGFEYALAALLMSEGLINEGRLIVRAVRSRYDGERRNPWNEYECGSHYARSMASYSLLPVLSGFTFDMPNKSIGFAPKINSDNFKCIFSVDAAWGTVYISGNSFALDILGGELPLSKLQIPCINKDMKFILDGKEIVPKEISDGVVTFDPSITVCSKLKGNL